MIGNLSVGQARVLDFIVDYYRKTKTTPSTADMVKFLGIGMTYLRDLLAILVDRGYLRKDKMGNRNFYVILRTA